MLNKMEKYVISTALKLEFSDLQQKVLKLERLLNKRNFNENMLGGFKMFRKMKAQLRIMKEYKQVLRDRMNILKEMEK